MLTIKHVDYGYDNSSLVLSDVSLDVEHGEIVCLLGESGSGKSTLLRIVAGLEDGYDGDVLVDGRSIKHVAVHQRGFGLMFQDFALFPHMNVEQNVSFGLKMQGMNRKQRKKRVDYVLKIVGMESFHKRSVGKLSGGQKQRVALARSLASQPRLLMLDEPLGSLDKGLRDRLVIDIREIIKDVGLTAIYVTHDQQEAYAIGDRVAIMNEGRIEQIDTPRQLYLTPKTRFVAQFLGLDNIFSADALPHSTDGDTVLFHPEGLRMDDSGDIDGVVREQQFHGDHFRVVVEASFGKLAFSIPSYQKVPQVGERVTLTIDEQYVIPLND